MGEWGEILLIFSLFSHCFILKVDAAEEMSDNMRRQKTQVSSPRTRKGASGHQSGRATMDSWRGVPKSVYEALDSPLDCEWVELTQSRKQVGTCGLKQIRLIA